MRSGEEIQGDLRKFVARWRDYSGSERSEAQTFLNELIHCYGVDRKAVGARYEDAHMATGLMDLHWPAVCIVEMKAAAKLAEHRKQAFDYWHSSDDAAQNRAAPPYVVLCAFQRFEIWEPGRFPLAPRADFTLDELPENYEKMLFLTGTDQEPLFGDSYKELTIKAAKVVVELYQALLLRKAATPETLRSFLLQTVWCLFAEDLGMLEEHPTQRIVEDLVRNPERSSYTELGTLFDVLNGLTDYGCHGVLHGTRYVNGSLFDVQRVLEELCAFRVLDPACGCGSFLYVAYRELRCLEHELKERLVVVARQTGMNAPDLLGLPYYRLGNLRGIDIEQTVVLIARLTLWNSISQNRARSASLEYITANGGVITDAVSSQDWPGEASVHVSPVNWIEAPTSTPMIFVLDGEPVDGITPELRTPGHSTGVVANLKANKGRCFQGPIPVGDGFIITAYEVQKLLRQTDANYREVMRPYLIGDDIAENPRQEPRRWIIDFAQKPLEAAAKYPDALKIVRQRDCAPAVMTPGPSRARRRLRTGCGTRHYRCSTFPWPDPVTDKQRERIAEASRRVIARRRQICAANSFGLNTEAPATPLRDRPTAGSREDH